MLALINLVPKTVYAAAVAALLAAVLALGAYTSVLKVDVANAATKYSQFETKVTKDDAQRERVARENAIEIKRAQEKHAAIEQEKVHDFHKQADADRQRNRALESELDQLRNDLTAYATAGQRASDDVTDTCRDQRNRSERLSAALAEAVGLQVEAENFIRQRDREVKLLKDAIGNDRDLINNKKEQP